MVYGCETYDFKAELAKAQQRRRKQSSGLDANSIYWRMFFKPPTVEAFHRHAERFGPELVRDTAAAFGIDLRARNTAAKPKRQRRTGPSLKSQVLELRGRGIMPTAIADALNISDRRVREILRAAA
jgi:hypothetical protein